jgi:hypothetical protein
MSDPHDDDTIDALLRQQFDGPVPDDGFSARVMQRLPPRRRHVTWPLWAGILVGAGACWSSLLFSPLLRAGWQDWLAGELSMPAFVLLVAMAGMSALAGWWCVAEAGDR